MGGDHSMSRSDSHVLRSLSHGWRSDEELWGARIAQKNQGFTKIERANSGKCFVYLFILILLSVIAALVFADLLLSAARPKLTLRRLRVTRLTSGVTNNVASLKLTAEAELKLHNADMGRFQYRTGTITVLYGKATLGKGSIRSGVVAGRESARINAVVEMKAESEVGSSRLVRMQWVAQLRGQVRLLNLITLHRGVSSTMNCTLTLNLASEAVQDLTC